MKQQEEKEFKELFSALETEQPSMRFTKNVMDSIEGLPVASVSKHYVNPWIVKGIAASLIVVILILSGYIFINAGSQTDYTAGLNSANHVEFLHKIKGSFALYAVLVNALLFLILIERLVSSKRRIHYLERLN
jgi:hypothetical protein